ncbi:MAG TPA: response regulator transcription factor [Bacteroidota bacterium]|nr:response regulator transcription factor [Bacteroidota bacterium]
MFTPGVLTGHAQGGRVADGQRRVLIVEDDRDIAQLVELHLRDLGCRCDIARDGEAGMAKATSGEYDLIILDLMLPGIDGTEICREVRAGKNYTPIMMLTARSEELDRVLGLELGADDYLTKPFSIREFIARVKAIFRRVGALKEEQAEAGEAKLLSRGALKIDRENRKVTLGGRKIELTPKEYDLLVLFAAHPGRTYTREQLLNTVWGPQFEGYDHTVNSHINRLRAKIEEDVTHPQYIRTSWGVGYRFADGDELPESP